MSDDEPPRSSPLTAAGHAMTELLLLLGVLLLVAANGFFVAAEFALVRAREGRVEQMRDEGRRGAALVLAQLDRIDEYLSACQLGITMASLGIGFLGEPAIASLLEDAVRRRRLAQPVAGDLAHVAYLITTALHITLGEQVPKIYAIIHAERTALRVARPLHWFRVAFSPLIWALNSASNGMLRAGRRGPEGRVRGGLLVRGPEDDHRPQHERREARPRRGGDALGVFHLHEQEARQVMTPIPAVVTVDISETAETALRRASTPGHTRLVVTEDGNTDRIKGIVHNNSLARRLMTDGPEALDRGQREGRADRARDQAARRPARRPPARARLDGRGGRRVRAHRRHRHDRGHHRGGRGRDRRRDRPGGGRHPPAGQRRLVGARPRADHRPRRLRARPAGRLGRLQLGRRLRVRRAGAAAQARRHGAVNGYSLRVESVRENRIEAVRIRDHHAERARGDAEPPRPGASAPFRP